MIKSYLSGICLELEPIVWKRALTELNLRLVHNLMPTLPLYDDLLFLHGLTGSGTCRGCLLAITSQASSLWHTSPVVVISTININIRYNYVL